MENITKGMIKIGIREQIKRLLPYRYRAMLRSLRKKSYWGGLARSIVYDCLDLLDVLRGRRSVMTPPRKLVHGIGGDFEVGRTYLKYFHEIGGLQPDDFVLDVGCGVGRMACPLTSYLSKSGRYQGFDIVSSNITWCTKNITTRFPNFRFLHADIFNKEYNPGGINSSAHFHFPYDDSSFDFAILTSVFTHLLADETAHYLAEVARVLRPGGRCLCTFFLLNIESSCLIEQGESRIKLHPLDNFIRVNDYLVPEACVAIDQEFVMNAATSSGLETLILLPGNWCGRPVTTDFQDIVVFLKR